MISWVILLGSPTREVSRAADRHLSQGFHFRPDRSGWQVVQVYEDAGISGAKGRDKRPAFDGVGTSVVQRVVSVEGRFGAAA